jgi:hypothetical protein
MTVGGTVKKTPVAILAASLLLAACGGAAKPDASSTSTSPSTSTSAPTVSDSPITAPTIDPTIPAAARAHTPAGAAAFVRYFYSQLNIAWSKPQTGLISALSAKTCKTCAALEGTTADLAAKRQHYRGEVLAVKTIGSIAESEVLVVGEQPIGAVIDVTGAVVKSGTKAQLLKFVVTVTWSSEGWRVEEIRVRK